MNARQSEALALIADARRRHEADNRVAHNKIDSSLYTRLADALEAELNETASLLNLGIPGHRRLNPPSGECECGHPSKLGTDFTDHIRDALRAWQEEPNPKPALPAFMDGAQLVEFHREEPWQNIQAARAAQSPELDAIQQKLDAMMPGITHEYEVDDIVVTSDAVTAEGVTSWFPALDEFVEQDADHWGDGAGGYLSTMHRPVLDIDFEAALIPSSTPGHYHLYLDKLMPWAKYRELVVALGVAGILEPGYATATVERGYSSARLPGVAKRTELRALEEQPTGLLDSMPTCFRCGTRADQFTMIVQSAQDENLTVDEWVVENEGTYNAETNHFACDKCYIEIGMPSGEHGWKAP